MTTPNVSNEIKATLRALEDHREVLQQLIIEREFLRRDVVSLKEQGSVALKHHLSLKKILEALEESNKLKREQLESVASIRQNLRRGTIQNVLSFSEDKVEKFKQENNEKKATSQNMLQKKIEEHTKNSPLAIEYKKNEAEYSRISLAHDKLVAEVAVLTQEMNAEKDLNKLLLQEHITEMAQQIQRYHIIDDKLRNPNKVAEKSAPSRVMALMVKNQNRLKKPVQSSEASSQKEVPDEVMPETSSTSKYQETFDTNKASASQAFERGSVLRLKKRLEAMNKTRNEAINKQQTPKTQDVSQTQPSIQKDVRAEHKEKSDSEQTAKQVMPRSSLLKAATESTDSSRKTQISKKRKSVTFVDLDSSGSGFEMDDSKEGGFSSTNFKNAASNDRDMDLSLENEIQMSDSDEANLQAGDGEKDENHFDQQFGNYELGFDASAEDAAGFHSNESEFDSEFSSSMFRPSGPDSQPTDDCDFDMNFMDDEIDDMNSIFAK